MLASGDTVDRYVIDAAIGAGGLARVYRVHHAELGSVHALKVLQYSGDRFRERLREEGRIQIRLRHPNVVAVTDMVRHGELPCLVMEYVRGPALDLFLDEVGPLPFDQLDVIAHDMLSGLAHAHRLGMIHRDLKPSNVLLAIENGSVQAKVTDYGLGKILDSGELKTRTNVSLGTPAYMAPEQIRDAKTVDARADVYAAGVLLYELLTGQRCFPQQDLIERYQASRDHNFWKSRELRADAPARMHHAIEKALRYNREERPADAGELLALWSGGTQPPPREEVFGEELLATLESLRAEQQEITGLPPPPRQQAPPTTDSPPPQTQTSPTPVREGLLDTQQPWRWGVAVVVLVGLLGTAWFAAGTREPATITTRPPESPPVEKPAQAGEATPAVTPEGSAGTEEGDATAASITGGEAGPSEVVNADEPVAAPDRVPPVDASPAEPVQRTAAEPTSAPAGEPATSVPRPAPSSAEEPKPAPVLQTATVSVAGVERAVLRDAWGVEYPPGKVAAGSWSLVVYFAPDEPTAVMQIEVSPGETRQVRCDPTLKLCR